MKNNPTTISFDETDANILYRALYEQLQTKRWDPTLDNDWEQVRESRRVLDALIAFLDGAPVNE